MDNHDRFDALLKPWGGRFPHEHAPEKAHAAYNQVAARADDLIQCARSVLTNLPPIHFDFFHNSSVNAVALKSDGEYFIGFSTGSLYMLSMLVFRFLSHARLFPSVGDPAKEIEDLPPMDQYAPDAEEVVGHAPRLEPKDPIRWAYADFLRDQAILFLVGHELAHITLGHVDYLFARGRGATVEVNSPTNSDEEKLERQMMEIDADRRSIISRIDSLRVTFQGSQLPAVPWAKPAEIPGRLFEDWAVAFNVVFQLFGNQRLNSSRLADVTYPPIAIRLFAAEADTDYAISRIFGDQMKDVGRRALHAARQEVSDAFATLIGHDSGQAKVSQEFVLETMEYFRHLEAKHPDLLEHLRKYSHEKAPSDDR